MSSNSSRVALKMLLGRDVSERKREKLVGRIVEYLVSGHDEDRLERIEEIFGVLGSHVADHPDQKADIDALVIRIVAGMIDCDGYDLVYEVGWRMWGQRSLKPSAFSQDEDGLHRSARDPLSRFMLALFRLVGQTIERSMEFALDLQERIGLARSFYYDDSSSLAKPRENPTERAAVSAIRIIQLSAIAPHSERTPAKLWMLRLLENAELNSAVDEILSTICSVMTVEQDDAIMSILVMSDRGMAKYLEEYKLGEALSDSDRVRLILPESHLRVFKSWSRRHDGRTVSLVESSKRIIAWYRYNQTALDENARRMLHEVATSPRRGLRPHGFDHVDINVSALYAVGVRGVVFRPEGFSLPDTGLEVLIRKLTPHLFKYHGTLYAFEKFNPVMLENKFIRDKEMLRDLLRFVIIDLLHRITVRELQIREKPRETGGDDEHGPQYPVRPHLRRLVHGSSASMPARKLGRETFGYDLPEGVTFIRAHFSHGRMTYELPTTAFAEYGDEDLLRRMQ